MNKYEERICVVCRDEITHRTKLGTLIHPDSHKHKLVCNNPDCLLTLQSRNQQKHPKVFKPKKCKQCPRMISKTWPNGGYKSKPDHDKQQFCCNVCRANWKAENHWFPEIPETKRTILCHALRVAREYPSDSIENFIHRRVV